MRGLAAQQNRVTVGGRGTGAYTRTMSPRAPELLKEALTLDEANRAAMASRRNPWLLGVLSGLVTGLAVAVSMSFLDWRLNPAGLFHSENGTNWGAVIETAISWFVPVALLASAIVSAVLVSSSRKS